MFVLLWLSVENGIEEVGMAAGPHAVKGKGKRKAARYSV